MKKILSFLTKKPLALAAVALFSVSAFADEATGGPASTPEEKLNPVEMWARVSATNPLHYFDRVTVVDETYNVAYADKDGVQIDAVPFKTETGGTSLPKNASYFWVAEGATTKIDGEWKETFSLSKGLTQKDGKYVDAAGNEVSDKDVPVGDAGAGARGVGPYLREDAGLSEAGFDPVMPEVSWRWSEMSTAYYLFTASNGDRFVYYNPGAKRFKDTVGTPTSQTAKLYKVVTVYSPYFKDPEGPQKLQKEDDTYKAEIINPVENKGGELKYRFEGEGDDAWKPYPDGGVPCETGKETTIETKIDFEGGSTPIVGRTFVPVYVPAPEITAELDGDGNLKINKDGEAPVNIKSEDGTTLTYSVGTGKATELDTNEKDVDLAYIADQDPNKTPVTAVAVKEVEYTPWPTKDNTPTTGTVTSDPTTENFTVVKFADRQDVFTEFKADPKPVPDPESKVDLGQTIQLWFDLTDAYKDVYTIKANNKENKTLDLHFKGVEKAETVDLILNEETGRMEFTVPTKEEYANSEFYFDVPEGFYYAYTGIKDDGTLINEVKTLEEKNVTYTTGLAGAHFTLDCDLALDNVPAEHTKYLTTDDVFVDFQVWLDPEEQDVVVDFSDEAKELYKTDQTLGVHFTDQKNNPVTAVERVEKLTKDEEGNDLPNIFRVFFKNEADKDNFVEKALKDENLVQKGYIIGFPAGTFVSGNSKNKDELSAHLIFNEAVELTLRPLRKVVCEFTGGIAVQVIAKGKLFDTDYGTPYWADEAKTIVNTEKSKIQLNAETEVTIDGTDCHNVALDGVKGKITTKFPADFMSLYGNVFKNNNTKDIFYLEYTTTPETPDEDGPAVLQEDNGRLYTITVPAGAFSVNDCKTKDFTGEINVMAHPVWEVTARPYTYEDPEVGVTTLTLDGKATLDDKIDGNKDEDKSFERNVHKFLDGKKITVDTQEITDWTITEVSDPKLDENGRWYETFVVNVPLTEPIKDVAEHTVTIEAQAFRANECNNKEIVLTAYPEVKYAIQQIKYCISTAATEVTYYIWATLPDKSYLNKPIKYIGNTGEGKTPYNAAALNNAVNENTEDAKYPVIEAATEVGTYKDHPATLFTVKFDGIELKPWVAKMTFPGTPELGTVQAEGYVANDEDLWNNITIVPDIEFDATSSRSDFQDPGKKDKEKVYNISTSDKTIDLYLTGWNKYNSSNANKQVKLIEGSELLISQDGKTLEDVTLTWEPAAFGSYTYYKVTFRGEVDEDGDGEPDPVGLEPGSYTMTVQEHNVINTNYDTTCNPMIGCDNETPFELTINVEDFAEDAEVEITTKTWAFEVPVVGEKGNVKEVYEGKTATLAGKTVKLSKGDTKGTIKVTMPGDDAYDFISTPGEYTFDIPANTFEGDYAPCTVDIPVKVNVIFHFFDSMTGETDDKGNDLVTTKEEVADAVGVQEKMYYTRNFKSTRLQQLAVPFDVALNEVDFKIYRINAVTIIEETEELNANFVAISGEGAKAYNNKPYAIKPAAEGLVKYEFEKKEVFPAKVAEGEDAIRCSTTKVRFDFKNTIEDMTGSFLTLGKGKDGKAALGTQDEGLAAWRWYVESSDKTVNYIKVAINGVDVDATGIDFVEAAEGDTQIFNVAGQRLNAPAKGKVNIINGKKVFVK